MIKTQTQHNRNIEKLTLKKLMPIFKKLRASSVRALIVHLAHADLYNWRKITIPESNGSDFTFEKFFGHPLAPGDMLRNYFHVLVLERPNKQPNQIVQLQALYLKHCS